MSSKEDRELLEMAAKAVGINLEWDGHPDKWQPMYYEGKTYNSFEPLTNNGGAFLLAVNLRIDLTFYNGFQEIHAESSRSDGLNPSDEKFGDDVCAATRRAIVRAAAEIGKSMP